MKYACIKIVYKSEESAARALEDARHDRGRPKGRNIRKVERRYYLCQCGGYHLTSMKRHSV